MTNKDLIIYLKQLFDRFDINKFVYAKKDSHSFNLIQKRHGILVSEVGKLPFNWINYAVITPKHLIEIKNKLLMLYEYSFNRNIYIELKLIDNGFKYKVIDYIDNNKIITKGELKFKSTPSFVYYFVFMIKE